MLSVPSPFTVPGCWNSSILFSCRSRLPLSVRGRLSVVFFRRTASWADGQPCLLLSEAVHEVCWLAAATRATLPFSLTTKNKFKVGDGGKKWARAQTRAQFVCLRKCINNGRCGTETKLLLLCYKHRKKSACQGHLRQESVR